MVELIEMIKGFDWMRLEEDFMRHHTEQDNVRTGLDLCIIHGETFMMFVARVASFRDDVELLRFGVRRQHQNRSWKSYML